MNAVRPLLKTLVFDIDFSSLLANKKDASVDVSFHAA